MDDRALAALIWTLGDGPEAAFAAVDATAEQLAARRYATILRLEPESRSRRLFSSVADTYPVGETKKLPPSPWRTHVVERGEVFMAANPAEIAASFPDPEVVATLGGKCLANVPVRARDGTVIGMFNVAAGQAFTTAELQDLRLLAALLGPAVAACPPIGSAPR